MGVNNNRQQPAAGIHESLKAVMDASPVGMLVFNDDERIVYANGPAQVLFGKKLPEPGRIKCGDFISCANRHADPQGCGHSPHCATCPLFQAIRSALAKEGEGGVAEGECLIERESGYDPMWVKFKVNRLVLGKAQNAVMVIEDITDAKLTEAALKESEAKYRALIENAGEVVLVAQDGQIAFVNRKAFHLFGHGPEELTGKPFVDFIYPEDRKTVAERHVWRAAGEDVPAMYPFRIVAKSGEIKWVEINAATIDWKGRPATLNFLADITERKEAEKANQKLQAQLFQAQRMESIGVLAGGVAHEFNNLLTAIIGNAQLALSDLPEGHPVREDIEEIKKAGDRGALLTRRLMTFSRMEVFHSEPMDLNDLIADMKSLLHRLIRENIALRFVLEDGLWPVVADPLQMEQVVMNLAVNARDVMLDGGVLTIQTANRELDAAYFAAHDVGEASGRYVMLSVTDTGAGMDEATLKRIFEPFFTTKEPGAGTGLGLSTVYGIVKQSGGYIWPYSEPGRGTTMKIYLPAARESVPVAEAALSPGIASGKGETVLVVEDDALLKDLAYKTLRKAGYRVLTAGDGQDALEIIHTFEDRIHVLLTDVVMPRMGGKELAKQARALRPEIKILYMSGYPAGVVSDPDIMGHEADFIEKPISAEVLSRKLREIIDRHDLKDPG